jgi:SAM-dependent methyltransferase
VQTDTTVHASAPSVPARYGRVWAVVAAALASVSVPESPARVLDCGGGSGGLAVPLAEAGARVTVVDVSADALATLQRRADEAGVGSAVTPVQADVEALGEAVPPGSFDLVLAHGILEAVDDVPAAFDGIAAALRPGGRLSVLVGNPVASVLARALAGELVAALAELEALDVQLSRPGPQTVLALCHAAGLPVVSVHGIGVFSDLVPGRALDAPGARETLRRLEDASSTRRPFTDIAARVHVLARRAGSTGSTEPTVPTVSAE